MYLRADCGVVVRVELSFFESLSHRVSPTDAKHYNLLALIG